MADVLPFDALTYNTQIIKNLSEVVTQPYDKINESLKEKYLKRSEYNAVRLILPDLINEIDPDSKYLNAKVTLENWKNKKILKHLGKKAFYYLEQKFISPLTSETMIRKGFVGLLRFTDFSERIVFPHEKTLSKPKEDRFNLTLKTNVYFEQIFLMFEDKNLEVLNLFSEELSSLDERTLFSATDDYNVQNDLFPLSNPTFIEKVSKLFEDKKFVIADGHHRYETGVNYMKYMKERNTLHNGNEPYNFGMMFFSPSNDKGLIILPTHRLIHNIDNFSTKEFIKNLSTLFTIEEFNNVNLLLSHQTGKKHSFGFYSNDELNKFYLLTLKENPKNIINDKPLILRDLDVTILHSLILDKELGINEEKLKQQTNVEYVREIDEGLEEVRKGKEQAIFILNPTPVEKVMEVAQSEEVMPQKSTDFYPKLITGLVMYNM